MAHMISHYYKDGTAEQYDATVAVIHPDEGLPAGQLHHAAGPCQGGFFVTAVWESEEANAAFQRQLRETLPTLDDGLSPPAEVYAGPVHWEWHD